MDRSLYTDDAEVTERQLDRTEDTRAFHILERFKSGAQMGVRSGLTVSVNAVNPDLVDITSGTGYAPNGEYIELLQPLIQQALPGGSTEAVVGLVYTEISTDPVPVATSAGSANSQALRAVRPSILTPSQFSALPDSDDDLSVDAKDRFMIIAIVTFGTPNTVLNAPAFEDRILTVTQPSVITGIVITGIDDTTSKSDPIPFPGVVEEIELRFDPATGELEYHAPHDVGGFGSPVLVTSGGPIFTVASSNGQTLEVEITTSLLPSSGPPVTDSTIFVDQLYDKTANRVSSDDAAHRSILGSRVPTEVNPHGVRLQDIATPIESVPGQIEYGTELTGSFPAVLTPRILTPNATIDTAASSFSLLWEIPGSGHAFGPLPVRFYASRFDSLIITVNARWVEDTTPSANWVRDATGLGSIKFEIASAAFVLYQRTSAEADTWADIDWTVNEFHSTSTNRLQLTGHIELGVLKLDTQANVETSRITTHYSKAGGRTRTKIWESRGVTTPGLSPVFDTGESAMAIYRVFGNDGMFGDADAFELVRNAVWDDGANTWSRVGGSAFATKVFISNERIAVLRRTSAGSWADNAWDTTVPSAAVGPTGALDVGGAGTFGGDGEFGGTLLDLPNNGIVRAAAFRPYTNPPGGGPVDKELLYKANTPRAWLVFDTDGAGGVTNKGFNLAVTSLSPTTFTVEFDAAAPVAAQYCVLLTVHASSEHMAQVIPGTETNTGFDFVIRENAGAGSWPTIDPQNDIIKGSVLVMGFPA
jgi:hypothetical protein